MLTKVVLQDVLAICSGNLPAWVKQLVFDCKFLFPFDLRRRYFYCTASGLARALQHLQQQQTAEGATSSTADRELRVSRIQRSKVCSFPFPATCTHTCLVRPTCLPESGASFVPTRMHAQG